jgi:hypothetical protein
MSLIQIPTFKMRHDEHIVPLQREHLSLIELGPHEQEYERVIPNYRDYIYNISEPGWSFTAIGRGKIIACYGLRQIWPHLVECWFIPGEGLDKHARTTLVGARATLQDAFDNYGIARMQIFVKDQHMVALRFAKALHFDVECKLRKFGPEGADYYSMARFK